MKSSLTKNEDALNPILYHTINGTFNLSSSLQITINWFQVNCNSQDGCKKTIEKFLSQTIYKNEFTSQILGYHKNQMFNFKGYDWLTIIECCSFL